MAMDKVDGLPVFDVDPYAEALLREPAAYYQALRACGPLVWIPRYGVCASGHISVVEAAFRDWRRFSSARGVGLADFSREPPWRPPSIILEVDPPAHERTRRVMARALSPQAGERAPCTACMTVAISIWPAVCNRPAAAPRSSGGVVD